MLLVTPLREVDVLERERLLVERGWLSLPGPFPGAGVAEVRVVASGLALRGLALDAEVAAAGLTPVERIEAHQLRELEEVRDAAGLLERLVQLLTGPEHAHVPVELLAQLRDLRERPPETGVGPGHAAVVPPEPAHRVVRRRIDAHGHAIGVVAGDAVVDLEEIAVLLPDVVETEPRDGVGEVEVDPVTAGPDPATLVAHLLGGP